MEQAQPQRRPGIEAKDIGAETLLYNDSGEEIHVLNATAKFIWELCDGQHSPADIEAALRAEFEIAPEMNVNADVERVLGIFHSKNLLAS